MSCCLCVRPSPATGSNPALEVGCLSALAGDMKLPGAQRADGLDVRVCGLFVGQALGGFGRHEATRHLTNNPTLQGCKGQECFES